MKITTRFLLTIFFLAIPITLLSDPAMGQQSTSQTPSVRSTQTLQNSIKQMPQDCPIDKYGKPQCPENISSGSAGQAPSTNTSGNNSGSQSPATSALKTPSVRPTQTLQNSLKQVPQECPIDKYGKPHCPENISSDSVGQTPSTNTSGNNSGSQWPAPTIVSVFGKQPSPRFCGEKELSSCTHINMREFREKTAATDYYLKIRFSTFVYLKPPLSNLIRSLYDTFEVNYEAEPLVANKTAVENGTAWFNVMNVKVTHYGYGNQTADGWGTYPYYDNCPECAYEWHDFLINRFGVVDSHNMPLAHDYEVYLEIDNLNPDDDSCKKYPKEPPSCGEDFQSEFSHYPKQ